MDAFGYWYTIFTDLSSICTCIVCKVDMFPVMLAAVNETSNKIVIGVVDTGELFSASVNDTG